MQFLSESSLVSANTASSTATNLKFTPKSTMNLNRNSKAFVNLIGMPPCDILDPSHTLGPGLASTVEAQALNATAFPKLEPNESASTKLVDTIDASNEDPFTLETFEQLIRAHTEAGKDFIFARVLTMDEKADDQKTLFYSYYAAHQINRTLFRTQPEEGLLHRMKAKNPMNNLTIVGDVHYYVIRHDDPSTNPLAKKQKVTFDINKSTSMISFSDNEKIGSKRSELTLHEMLLEDAIPSSIDSNSSRDLETRSVESHSSAPAEIECFRSLPDLSHGLKRLHNRRSSIEYHYKEADKRPKINAVPSDEFLSSNKASIYPQSFENQDIGKDSSSTSSILNFSAQYYATDDDFLMRRYIREFFKQNALNTEDIFLFTLFGASQHNGESFSAPFVSDPTNPNAIAAPLDEATSQYLASLQPGYSQQQLLLQQQQQRNSTSSIASTTVGNTFGSILIQIRDFFASARNPFANRHVSTAIAEGSSTDVEQGFEIPVQSADEARATANNRRIGFRLAIVGAGPFLTAIGAAFITSPYLLVVYIMALVFLLLIMWRLTGMIE